MSAQQHLEQLEIRRLLSANLVADVGGIYPSDSVSLNGVSYFAAQNVEHGTELWRSDGTQPGTRLVKDLTAGAASSDFVGMTALNGKLMIFKRESGGALSLWRSDGTAAGTVKVVDISGYWDPEAFAVVNGKLLYVSYGGNDSPTMDLWSTDGTTAGTRKIAAIYDNPDKEQVNFDQTFSILPVGDGSRAVLMTDRLWSTDGTAAGTFVIPGFSYINHQGIRQLDGKVVFSYDSGGVPSLWSSDGTIAGTHAIMALPNTVLEFYPFADGTKLLFGTYDSQANTRQLWVTDATAAGTVRIANWPDSQRNGIYASVGTTDDKVIMPINNTADHTVELWASDGTEAGTQMLATLGDHLWAPQVVSAGGMVFLLTMQDGTYQETLWQTDGTVAGTKVLQDVTALGSHADNNWQIAAADGKLVLTGAASKTRVYDPAEMLAPAAPIESRATLRDGTLRVFGTSGDDAISVYRMLDHNDRLVVNINGNKRTFAIGQIGKIVVYGYEGDDQIRFSQTRGIITVRSRIYGGDGDDSISTSAGRDTIWGEAGDDLISSGRADDQIWGGEGNDSLSAGAGNDTAGGQDGTDSVSGGAGNDFVAGGDDQGHDWLNGGAGEDVIFGQAVYDIFYSPKNSADSVLDDVLSV
jgi:ELWxxDGT repeat protein